MGLDGVHGSDAGVNALNQQLYVLVGLKLAWVPGLG